MERESYVVHPLLLWYSFTSSDSLGVFTHHDVRLGSSGSRWNGKQQGRRGLDLEGMPGRKAAWGIGFYGKLMGENFGSRSQIFWEVRGNRRCLVRVSTSVTKHHDQKCGRRGFIPC